MRKAKLYLLIAFALFVCIPFVHVSAQSLPGTGFVSAPIWYSPDPFYEGDSVRIYTFIFNGGKDTLKGTVEFYDGETLLTKKPFSLVGVSGADIYGSWKVTAGDHSISAKILSPKIYTSTGKESSVSVDHAVTSANKRVVAKKIVSAVSSAEQGTAGPVADNYYDAVLKKLDAAEAFIVKNTPDAVQKPIVAVADSSESVRLLADGLSTDGKVSAQSAIAELSKDTTPETIAMEQNKNSKTVQKSTAPKASTITMQKPFEYVKLYFWSLVHFIVSSAWLFYGLILAVLFFIVRAIVRKIRD